jgi:hypothetical protein
MCINMVQENNVWDGGVSNLSDGRCNDKLYRYNDRTACEVLSLNETVETPTSTCRVIVENKLLNIESVDSRKNMLQYGNTLIFCLIKLIWWRPLMLVSLSLVDNGILRPNLTLASTNFLVLLCLSLLTWKRFWKDVPSVWLSGRNWF